VALHDDALGPLDDGAPLHRRFELLDLLVQPRLLAVAPEGHLDGRLHGGRLVGAHVGGDPELGRAGHHVEVVRAAHLRQHGTRRVLHGLPDQREAVLLVVVQDDDGEVGVLALDEVDRLADGHRERRHLVPERFQDAAELLEGGLVLVGEEHPQAALAPDGSGQDLIPF
jgi:hypothetical protein